MDEKLTEELLNDLLFNDKIEDYLENHEVGDSPKLFEYLVELLKNKGLTKNDVIKNSKLNATFAYQIFSGERNPGRDKILQLTFAMNLTVREAQRALKFGGANELYPKNRRDAIIIYCLKNNLNLSETDDWLFRFGEKTIYEE